MSSTTAKRRRRALVAKLDEVQQREEVTVTTLTREIIRTMAERDEAIATAAAMRAVLHRFREIRCGCSYDAADMLVGSLCDLCAALAPGAGKALLAELAVLRAVAEAADSAVIGIRGDANLFACVDHLAAALDALKAVTDA